MAHMMKKADFQDLIKGMKSPKLKTFRGSVYLRDGEDISTQVEIYCASSMKEAGIISAWNQAEKYSGWM